MATVVILALAAALGPTLTAQVPHTIADLGNVRFVAYAPQCNPFQMRHDAVWIHGEGWTMPRIGWHVMYPTLNLGIAKGLTAIGVNRSVAAIGATVGLGLIPHVRQAALGLRRDVVYELNAPDWIFDLWNRSLPSWMLLSGDRQTAQRDVVPWIVGNIALSCFATP